MKQEEEYSSAQRQLWIWFSFDGRLCRSEYWLRGILLSFAIGVVSFLVIGMSSLRESEYALLALYGVSAWAALAIYSKRWHDIGKSGWMTLMLLVPLVNLAVFIYLGVEDSEKKANKYGEPESGPPKGWMNEG